MFFAFFFSVVNGAGFAMVSLFFSFLSTCYLGVFCCLSFHEFSSCLLLPREQTADFLYRWASHGQAEPLASSLFGRAFLALSFHDCFRVLLEPGGNARNAFVLPSRDLLRLFMVLHATFFLSPFAFLRLTVGRVSELLIRMLPHGLSDASA